MGFYEVSEYRPDKNHELEAECGAGDSGLVIDFYTSRNSLAGTAIQPHLADADWVTFGILLLADVAKSIDMGDGMDGHGDGLGGSRSRGDANRITGAQK